MKIFVFTFLLFNLLVPCYAGGESQCLQNVSSEEAFETYIRNLMGGDDNALKCFLTIRNNSDGYRSIYLDSSIGYSIKHHPVEAVDAISTYSEKWHTEAPSYAEHVCGKTDEDWNEEKNVKDAVDALEEIIARLNSLSSIKKKQRSDVYIDCMDVLNKRKIYWEKFIK